MCDVICAGVEVGFSASDYTVSEGGGVVTVVLQLSGQSDVPVSVLIHTNDGSATGKILCYLKINTVSLSLG